MTLGRQYAVRDSRRHAHGAWRGRSPATPYSRADLERGRRRRVAGFSGTATGRGWYQDAPTRREKIGTDVYADVQTVVYCIFQAVDRSVCARRFSSTALRANLLTGNSVLQSEGGIVSPESTSARASRVSR